MEPSLLERGLRLFAPVQVGEGVTVLLMFLNIFLILTAYYVLKVVREALTIGGVEAFGLPGDEIKAYLPRGNGASSGLELYRPMPISPARWIA